MKRTNKAATFPLVIIGSSTGGPPVLEKILIQLQACPQASIVIVQHMPAHFTKSMAERLDECCVSKVKEAEEGEYLNAGVVLIAPGDFHLEFQRSNTNRLAVHLTQDDKVHGLRPAIDITMKSAASSYGDNVTGIILTGMGEDGAVGMQHIKEARGHTIVQDPSTCVVDSMVQHAMGCDGVDDIFSTENIATYIENLSFSGA